MGWMNKLYVATLGIVAVVSPVSAVVMNTVATYDATTNANVVDQTAPASSLTLSQFQANLTAAHALDLGGVANFDLSSYVPAVDPSATTVFDFRLGATGSRNVRMTTSSSIDPVTSVSSSSGTITPISGTGVLANQTGSADLTMTFGNVTDTSSGNVVPHVGVTEVGFTILSRNTYPGGSARTFAVTATFSDGTTLEVSDAISNVKGGDDTFYSFKAPEYRFITSLYVNSNGTTTANSDTPVYDDFGIVVAPEPGSVALLGGAAGLLLRRRRFGRQA